MNIDRDNYEAWLLDRLEGRLTAEQERALEAFLAAHPELRAEAEALGAELPRISADPVPFGMADDLKRTIPPTGLVTDATVEDHLVARLEGDLDPQQLKALERYLYEHPEHERAARLVAASRVPQREEALPGRERLQKHFPPVGMPDPVRIVDFLIARLEGDLSAEQELALDRFLAAHPELDRVHRQVKAARITSGPVAVPDRGTLEKHFPPIGAPDRARITDFLIAAHEGDLDAPRRKALAALVASDAVLQREERLVAAARVHPMADTFPLKERLKKREGRVVPLWSFGGGAVRWAAAASVLLLLGMAWWLLREGPQAGGEFARKEPVNAPVAPQQQQPAPVQQADDQGPTAPAPALQREVPASGTEAPGEGATPGNGVPRERRAPAPAPAPAPDETPLLAQQPQQVQPEGPVPAVVPAGPVMEGQALAAAPTERSPMGRATEAHTVRELLTAGVRERVLDEPADVRPLDRTDAVALADRGLKGLTGGNGGVQVQRTAKRDRFEVRLGDGLAFSGSIGR